jgi:hypothetical protein
MRNTRIVDISRYVVFEIGILDPDIERVPQLMGYSLFCQRPVLPLVTFTDSNPV